MTKPAVEFDLQKYIVKLLQNEPFFATISRHVEKMADKNCPTAGVRINGDGHFEMRYNPEFFEKLPMEQRAGVIMHEFYHLIFGHVTDLPGYRNHCCNLWTVYPADFQKKTRRAS